MLEAIDDKAKEEDNGLTGPSHLLTDQSANRVKFDSDDEGDQDDVDRWGQLQKIELLYEMGTIQEDFVPTAIYGIIHQCS